MKFGEFARFLAEMEGISSRIGITEILAKMMDRLEVEEMDKAVYMALGKLAPPYESLEMGLAERMLGRVVAKAVGVGEEEAWREYKEVGDWGGAIEGLHTNTRSKVSQLTVGEVYERMVAVAREEGQGSQERKVVEMARLLGELGEGLSMKYAVRVPMGRLRLGFSEATVLDALSVMVAGDKRWKKALDFAYQVTCDVGVLARRVKAVGIERATRDAHPVVGVPVVPMLAQRLKSPKEMIEKMKEVSVEGKLDGLRLQIHYKRGREGFVKAFTRNLKRVEEMFPELGMVGDYLKADEAILDCEVVGVGGNGEGRSDFQTTMKRRRVHEIAMFAESLPVTFYLFDILSKDGVDLMGEGYALRRKMLEKVAVKGKIFDVVGCEVTSDPGRITEMHEEKRREGLEGIVVKRVDSRYVPGRTGWRWVKMKEEEAATGKLADTIDGVVMGFNRGRGKRARMGLGDFLVGVRSVGRLVTVTEVGTGLTDEMLVALAGRLGKLIVEKRPEEYEVSAKHKVDYWVRPEVVVEVAGDDITRSPAHTGGLAIRFPRLVRIREDKGVKEASTVDEVKRLYEMQSIGR